MPWGILEDKHMEHVPGTVVLADQSDVPPEFQDVPREILKHASDRYSSVILVPQPSDSPNDPLNWPTWQKDAILVIVGLSAAVVGAYGPMLSPGFVEISAALGITINTLSQATAWVILLIGISLFIFNPLAKKYGRRPVYVICSIIMLSGSLWGGFAKDYKSFLGSRIWSGLGMAPYEVLVQCTIADMYYVHQRATRIAAWNMFLRSLRMYHGVYTQTSLWKIFLRPVVVFWYPAVLWAFLLYGATLTWIVVFSVVNAAIFTAPPYNFSVSETGLISVSPFVLTFIGEVISGPLNDRVCLWLAKKNHGIYEPEFRLATIPVPLLIGVVGFYGFGATIHFQTHWIGPVLCFGLANMSLAFANGCVFGYVIDAHKDLSEEAFVAINARNFLTFGLTYFVNDWLAKDGVLAVFNVLGSIFVAVNLLTIPLWIFGKRIRGFIARSNKLQKFMHED